MIFFFFLYTKFKKASFDNNWFCLNFSQTLILPMHFSSAVLMKLCICFGICLSSKWLYLRLIFFFSFLKPWADNGSTNQYSCQLLYGWGWHTPCHSISKMHTVGETGETPSALSCFSFLIRSLLTNITWKLLSHVQLLVTPWTVVHGIPQARILEWIAFPFSRVSSQPRDQTQVSRIAGDSLPAEPQGKQQT